MSYPNLTRISHGQSTVAAENPMAPALRLKGALSGFSVTRANNVSGREGLFGGVRKLKKQIGAIELNNE
ncbi:MAG: hypothetical protein DRG82_16180 [Deltaproteobacteria bacterium]|nr:MAG: hypothetical protein B1H13_13475 [Desulfobacteraceae bacterium 4484_190.3]RLB13168.1 MAG: hypothetical protein DRG82_16180 [Deltaproteobacteria bacterium]